MATDFVKGVSFYQPEQEEIARRRKMAELLMQQGQTPLGPTENIGGWAVKRSPMEGIGKIAQSVSGAYQQNQATEMQKALAERMRADRSQDYQRLMEAQTGTPAVPPPTDEAGGGPYREAMPATGINPALIAQLRSPEVQQLAAKQMMEMNKPIVLGRSLVNPSGKTLAVDQTWQQEQEATRQARSNQARAQREQRMQELQMRLQDRQLLSQDRASLQRELAQMQIDARREIAAGNQALRRDLMNVNRPKLKPGERFTAEGNVEAIPGSSEFVKQSGLHGKDYQGLLTVDAKTTNASAKIDEILDEKNKDAFNSNFGGYNALVSQYMPGAQDMRQKIESLKSDMKAAGLDIIRSGGGIGTMTEKEWPIVERTIDSISPLLDEKTARDRLTQVKVYLQKLRSNAAQAYDTEWGQTQFHKKGGLPPADIGAQPTAPTAPRIVDW